MTTMTENATSPKLSDGTIQFREIVQIVIGSLSRSFKMENCFERLDGNFYYIQNEVWEQSKPPPTKEIAWYYLKYKLDANT
jgi:hypothetical protein